MNLEDYNYEPSSYNVKQRLWCLQEAIQHHGYKTVLEALLNQLNSPHSNILEIKAMKRDIQILFFPYDTMITSSGNFYSEELGLYV